MIHYKYPGRNVVFYQSIDFIGTMINIDPFSHCIVIPKSLDTFHCKMNHLDLINIRSSTFIHINLKTGSIVSVLDTINIYYIQKYTGAVRMDKLHKLKALGSILALLEDKGQKLFLVSLYIHQIIYQKSMYLCK